MPAASVEGLGVGRELVGTLTATDTTGGPMTKKDYERAATLIQECGDGPGSDGFEDTLETFVQFFASDNPRFDEARFRAACVPGANVRARKGKAA